MDVEWDSNKPAGGQRLTWGSSVGLDETRGNNRRVG